MRQLVAGILGLMLLVSCATFKDSSGGGSGSGRVIGVRSYPYQGGTTSFGWSSFGEHITVKIIDSEWTRPYCSMQADGINCEFPTAYLMDFAAMGDGGWQWLSNDSALKICAEALWTVPTAPPDAYSQCAQSLVEMRWREAMPVTPDPNQ